MQLTLQLEQLVRSHGPLGIALAMTIENLVQVVPSLVILPLAGYGASKGWFPLPLACAATILGSLTGCLVWYGLGRLLDVERLERFVTTRGQWAGLTPARLRQSRRCFRRHGWKLVCWGRLIPVLRTNVSLPAGMELMPIGHFLAWSALGTSIWNITLVALGYALGSPKLI
ncbi:MAG: DedA family protein [Cyanobacteriota bacterium]|nr:DedA family protein [Cyanobacteriota bacterium]